jgi:hypothetical protein
MGDVEAYRDEVLSKSRKNFIACRNQPDKILVSDTNLSTFKLRNKAL